MTKSGDNHSITFGNATIAYLLSVTAAALSFTSLLEGPKYLPFTGFGNPGSDDLYHLSFTRIDDALFILILGWIVAFVSALIPFTASQHLINRFKAYTWPIFVGGGALTATLLFLAFKFSTFGRSYPPEWDMAFWLDCLQDLLRVVASGTVAGITCWLYIDNQFKKKNATARSLISITSNH